MKLLGATVLVFCVAGGGFIWSSAFGASSAPEPAALAKKATFSTKRVAMLAAQTARPSLQGTQLEQAAPGRARVTSVTLGGGDEVIAALTGSLTPVAVPSSDGSTVVYSSWHQISTLKPDRPGQGLAVGQPVGIPSVRVHDARGDRLIAKGAYSPALSTDGRLAYVLGDSREVRQNVDYTGKIVVANADGSSPQVWTADSARYFPYAWSGSTLLAYRGLSDSEAADLYAFTGAGQSRLLAPEALVVALSPDGSRVLVTVARRMVEIIRVSDGAIEAGMALDGDGVATAGSTTTPHALMFAGSWYGDRVVANSDAGLVVLDVSDGLRIESVVQTPGYATGITEPTLVDSTHLIGWANLGSLPQRGATTEPAYDNALVECDLSSGSCQTSTPSAARTWTRWVTNPSR